VCADAPIGDIQCAFLYGHVPVACSEAADTDVGVCGEPREYASARPRVV
jgi:hypothetical protein